MNFKLLACFGVSARMAHGAKDQQANPSAIDEGQAQGPASMQSMATVALQRPQSAQPRLIIMSAEDLLSYSDNQEERDSDGQGPFWGTISGLQLEASVNTQARREHSARAGSSSFGQMLDLLRSGSGQRGSQCSQLQQQQPATTPVRPARLQHQGSEVQGHSLLPFMGRNIGGGDKSSRGRECASTHAAS